MKQKTARQWFEMLNEPERSQAIENALSSDMHTRFPDRLYSSHGRALDSFVWEETEQGYEYWDAIVDLIECGTYPFKKENE